MSAVSTDATPVSDSAVEVEATERDRSATPNVNWMSGISRNQASRLAQVMTLPDGRTLGYAEYGDPNGRPVVFFHGTPGSRLQIPGTEDAISARGLRLIAIDRPGYGLSSPDANMSLLATAQDAAQLLKKLGIERCGVAGHSGGAPFAAALAEVLGPKATALTLLQPQGNPRNKESTAGLPRLARLSYWMMRHSDLLGTFFLKQEAALLADARTKVDKLAKEMPPSDRVLLADPAVREMFVASVEEGLRNGGAGHIRDNWTYMKGFDVTMGAIVAPTLVVSATLDANVTPQMATQWAQGVPGARTLTYGGEGHLAYVKHWNELLDRFA